jgi:hypothetical protein
MQKNLPGLTPVWLISLAAVLAYLIGLAGEAFNRGLYDFLKDFQGVIVGCAAFGIAYWAARPVYEQLKEVQRQSAVQTYEMLRQIAAALGLQRKLIDDLDLQSQYALVFEQTLALNDEINQPYVKYHYDEFDQQFVATEKTVDALKLARAQHPWGDAAANAAVSKLMAAVANLQAGRRTVQGNLADFQARQMNSRANWKILTEEARAISLKQLVEHVQASIRECDEAIAAELGRVRIPMAAAGNAIQG